MEKMVLSMKEAVFLFVELIEVPANQRRIAEMEGTAQFFLDQAFQRLIPCLGGQDAEVFKRKSDWNMGPNFLTRRFALADNKCRAQNFVAPYDFVKAGFENIHVQGANAVEQTPETGSS